MKKEYELNPIKLYPVFKDYIWGGNKLVKEYNKKCDMFRVAESWELSTHKDGESIVNDGIFKGLTLSEYIKKNEQNVLGENAEAFENFPILIKFIDAKEALSIQVHPDDEYSLKHNGEYGKTEMWYILDCEDDSYLYYGFKNEISKEEFKKSIEDNTLLDKLNKVNVKKGDVFFINAGTVHAIGKGIVICEVQQNSNTTYRVYDYDRIDKDGNKRPLHIEQAIEVAQTKPAKNYKREGNTLAKCKYFTVEEIQVNGEKEIQITDKSFISVIVVHGQGELIKGDYLTSIVKGDSIFIPAQNDSFKVKGECRLILSYL